MHDEVARMRGDGAEDLPLPTDFDYASLPGLSIEMRQRLAEVRPTSTAQASRIPGMTPAGLMCLWAFARQQQRRARAEATRYTAVT
jgi:tRNA uridine 5-carboxymethylaminomethyl modification enzyme